MNEQAMLTIREGIIHVSGELSFTTVLQLWKQSLPVLATSSALHFDFVGVTASNSAGVALMLEWIKYANRVKKPVSFSNIPAQLYSIIAVSGAKKILAVPA